MAPIISRLSSLGGGGTGGFSFGKRKVPSGGSATFSATGGSLIPSATSGTGYNYHIFTATGPSTFTVTSGLGTIDYLVIGAGGCGSNSDGGNGSGGGGAGKVTYTSSYSVSSGSYPITVGTGVPASGNGGVVAPSSSAFGTTSPGGTSSPGFSGSPGGPSGNGFSGGSGSGQGGCGGGRAGGGGAGASANGAGGSSYNGGAGGAGLAVPQFPGPVFSPVMPPSWISAVGPTGLFGGGGGGADERNPGPAGLGGPGGGGRGGDYDEGGTPGVTNTGSGGGGHGGAGCVISRPGGDGAPGIVSGSSQLTSSYDVRYILSGSIVQTTSANTFDFNLIMCGFNWWVDFRL